MERNLARPITARRFQGEKQEMTLVVVGVSLNPTSTFFSNDFFLFI